MHWYKISCKCRNHYPLYQRDNIKFSYLSFICLCNTVKPQIFTPAIHYTKIQGTGVNISCLANGVPNPTFKWFKDGHMMSPTFQSLVQGGSQLKLTNLTPQDAGNYSCYAENVAGNTTRLVGILTIHSKQSWYCFVNIIFLSPRCKLCYQIDLCSVMHIYPRHKVPA